MDNHDPHPHLGADDVRDSAFLACTILGAIVGAVASVVGSAEYLGGAYVESLAVGGALLGSAVFGLLGAAVVGPAWAALVCRRPVGHAADHDSLGDAVTG